MTNRAISGLVRLFFIAYALLVVRQFYVQVVAGPRLARDAHDPRVAALAGERGEIVARDGTVLARTTAAGRVYPFGASLAHVVGYASARYGTSGLEAAYDRELAARPVGNDPLAQVAALIGTRAPATSVAGATVVTTIDPVVQRALATALAAYPRAAGVAIDPRDGAVLALASEPAFDPARIDAVFPALVRSPASPLLDRAVDGLYPPGSTFKIFTAAAALDAGVTTMDATFDDPGTLPVGSFVVHDNEGEATGHRDLTGAFARSSNVDFARIALALGPTRWFEAAARWRLGEPLPFALPVARDRLPARAEMAPGILAQLGFGQADLLVTPLRMALVAATIAAGGTAPRPYLVREIRSGTSVRRVGPPAAGVRTTSAATAADVRDMMVAVVREGTGTAAALPDVTVAGKTGTATNAAGRSHAWFVAFAPADAPRVAVAVVVENIGYGGTFAAPIARRTIAAALARARG